MYLRFQSAVAGSVTAGAFRHELETYDELQRLGEMRSALRTLHRCWERVALEPGERGLLASLLSQEYARLHCLDDARSWLRIALGMRQRNTTPALRRACELAQVCVRLGEGRYADAVMLAERIAAKTRSRDAADHEQLSMLWCLAARACLELDAFDACADYVGRVLSYPLPARSDLRACALLLRAEAHIWHHMLASVEGRLARGERGADRTAGARAQPGSLIDSAARDLGAAGELHEPDRCTSSALAASQATVRVLRSFNYMDLQVINQHTEWLERHGLRRERDRQRVVVAFLHLSRGSYELTKGWSHSIAMSLDTSGEESGPSGALLVFAAACKGLGDEDLAVRLYGSYIRRQAQSRLSGSTFERSSVGGARQADGPDDEAASSCAGDRRAQLVARAVAFVDGQGDGPRQVDLVCEELGVSRRTLEMAFRAVTGESPKRYFDSVRAREALGYLREFTGAASRRAGFASRIAQRAGFSSYRAFYRIFVQLYGVSPVAAMAHPDLLGRLAANAPLGSRLDSRPESRLEARAEYIELGDALISGGGVV